jgi:ABC-2 type transport system ATP-binding protein
MHGLLPEEANMDRGPKSGTPAIRVDGLAKSFGNLKAVAGVDFSVEQGELFALLGPNGAGKTTTIKMLCCLLRPSGGTATILGHDIRRDPLSVKRVIDVSPQETAIAEHLTAWENLEMMAGLHGIDTALSKERTGELLEMMGLARRASERVKKYSGGMKRRLSLAMALISDPQVLFLDEPTLGLDPQSRRAIWDHIEKLKGTKTIVHTTHYLEEADALADRIAVIDEGRIIAMGTPDELKKSLSDGQVMVVECADLNDEAVDALRQVYPNLTRSDGGIEIRAERVDLYDIMDVLRPRGITIDSSHRKQVTLDDVFLELTGKQLRE